MYSSSFSGNPTFSNVTFNVYSGTPLPSDIVMSGVPDLADPVKLGKADETKFKAHLNNSKMYQITKRPKGRVLLINNEFLSKEDLERKGSWRDVNIMSELWAKIGCEVTIVVDLAADEIQETVSRFVQIPADFVAIVIMSHGGQNDLILGEDNREHEVRKIVDEVATSLKDKPKLLFFQMCRGDKTTKVHTDAGGMDSDDSSWMETLLSELLPAGRILGRNSDNEVADLPAGEYVDGKKDILLAFGTMPEHSSFRHSINGSWFIQSIAKVFAERAHEDDVVTMMQAVKNDVKKYKVDAPSKHYNGCVVSVDAAETFGAKKLFLFPGFPRARERVPSEGSENSWPLQQPFISSFPHLHPTLQYPNPWSFGGARWPAAVPQYYDPRTYRNYQTWRHPIYSPDSFFIQ